MRWLVTETMIDRKSAEHGLEVTVCIQDLAHLRLIRGKPCRFEQHFNVLAFD